MVSPQKPNGKPMNIYVTQRSRSNHDPIMLLASHINNVQAPITRSRYMPYFDYNQNCRKCSNFVDFN